MRLNEDSQVRGSALRLPAVQHIKGTAPFGLLSRNRAFRRHRGHLGMVFWKKLESVERMLSRYFDLTDACFERMVGALDTYFEKGRGEAFEAAVGAVHKAESECDDLRREIELTLYGQALLPESRGDILGLLEAFDGLPNIAETIPVVIHSQRMDLPDEFVPEFKKLIAVNVEAYALARKSVDALMTNPKVTLHTTKEVDQKESASDAIERRLICNVFDSDQETSFKILLKELVLIIGEVSDRAEKVADRIGIIAIKRQI
jgi:hypothetical protein